MHKIAILTYDGASAFELGCALELFALPRPEIEDWYVCEVISFGRKSTSNIAGLTFSTSTVVHSFESFDSVVIPSWPITQVPSDEIIQALQVFTKLGGRLLSFCSGAFLLAYAGLLNGKQGMTHWRYETQFKEMFTDVCYIGNALYTIEDNIACSAGSAAAIDLGIAIIAQDYGHHIAKTVAKRLVLSPHREGGQSQYNDAAFVAKPSLFSKSLDWAIAHLDGNIEIDLFAKQAGMSRRTFDRKFRMTFNTTPKTWLTQQRIAKAKAMLESTDFSIEKVAECSGFDNAMTMRHHFRKQLNTTPNQYRQAFTNLLGV